jgi:murein DD-endopeptidase MepM/ murein hydrolase activator NlpD
MEIFNMNLWRWLIGKSSTKDKDRNPRQLCFEQEERRELLATDLQGYWMLAANTAAWGQTFQVERAQIRNEGSTPSGAFYEQWYLSRDHYGSNDDVLLAQPNGLNFYYHDSIAANSYGPQFSLNLQLPGSPPAGSNGQDFFVVMKTDAFNYVVESNELNNFGEINATFDYDPIAIGGGSSPAIDLQGWWVVAPKDAQWGQVINIESQVINKGAGASQPFQIEWYVSRDRVVSNDDVLLYHSSGIAAYNHSGISGNGKGLYFSADRKLPPALPSGWSGTNFYIVMKVDSGQVVSESNEGNNSGQIGHSYDSADIAITRAGPPGDSFEPDDTPAGAATISTNGSVQTHSIHVGFDVDWVKFTLSSPRNVTIQTDGVSGGDTEMQLYKDLNGSIVQVPGGYDNNDGPGSYSRLTPSDTGALAGGTYYVRIKERGSDSAIGSYSIQVTASQNIARTPTGWYYPLQYAMTSTYGGAQWPDGNFGFWGSSKYFSGLRHIGVDLMAPRNTAVFTIGPGKVIAKSFNGWGDGNVALAILHSSTSGDFVAVYGHIRTGLKVGDQVTWGQQIGTIGPYPDGDHLHFGIRPGSTISGDWGRVSDPNGTNTNYTNGFVPPITWINTRTPKA